tara:strand:- start:225 stop:548 length:324 start_codon:yes stop_codon:yes gene_type:complete
MLNLTALFELEQVDQLYWSDIIVAAQANGSFTAEQIESVDDWDELPAAKFDRYVDFKEDCFEPEDLDLRFYSLGFARAVVANDPVRAAHRYIEIVKRIESLNYPVDT